MMMIKQIFLFSISFIAIFILSEIFIRTSNLASVSSSEFYDDIGRGRRKNLNYLYFNEGFGIGKFNEYRYVGESISPQKDKNTIRIALLGDSFIESFQIFERDYFGEIAENYLEKKYPYKRFEFLNFGRSGFNLSDIYAYQKIFVEKFNPDFILYFISNDDLEPDYSDPLKPKTIIENDSLIISLNFNSQEKKIFKASVFFTQNSSILNMLNIGIKRINKKPFFAILLDKIYFWFNPENKQSLIHSREQLSKYQTNPVLIKIIESLDTNKVIIVNRDLQELPLQFVRLCVDKGFNYFDLSKNLNLMQAQGNDPNEWKVTKKIGHWNQKAHKVVGEEIAKKLSNIIENE